VGCLDLQFDSVEFQDTCPYLTSSVSIEDPARCGPEHEHLWDCEHWNLTFACIGEYGITGSDAMIDMCAVLCNRISNCGGYTLDTSFDEFSGLCVVFTKTQPLRMEPTCFGESGIALTELKNQTCVDLIDTVGSFNGCDICDYQNPRRFASLTFRWDSDESVIVQSTTATVSFAGYVEAGRTITLRPTVGSAEENVLSVDVEGTCIVMSLDCVQPLVLGRTLSFPLGTLTLTAFVDESGATESSHCGGQTLSNITTEDENIVDCMICSKERERTIKSLRFRWLSNNGQDACVVVQKNSMASTVLEDGEDVTVYATQFSKGKFGANTAISVDDGDTHKKLHTSCSTSFDVGTSVSYRTGSLVVVGFEATDKQTGATVCEDKACDQLDSFEPSPKSQSMGITGGTGASAQGTDGKSGDTRRRRDVSSASPSVANPAPTNLGSTANTAVILSKNINNQPKRNPSYKPTPALLFLATSVHKNDTNRTSVSKGVSNSSRVSLCSPLTVWLCV